MKMNIEIEGLHGRKLPFAVVSSVVLATIFAMTLATTNVLAITKPVNHNSTTAEQQVVSYIDQRYSTDTWFRMILGNPVAAEQGTDTLRYRDYEKGRAYWTAQSGVREVNGLVKDKFISVGAHPVLGEPTTDESTTPDGTGKYNHFRGGSNGAAASIYWTSSTGAQLIQGAIRDKWATLNWERGPLGYPTTSETIAADGVSKYNNFQKHGTIYWSPTYSAQAVLGRIYDKWADYQYDAGLLGKPITSETATPDGVGRYNVFQGGSVYWSPSTDAHSINGAIRDRYAALGWERSYLGYPTSDEFSITNGRRSNFQNGFITWSAVTGQVIDYRY